MQERDQQRNQQENEPPFQRFFTALDQIINNNQLTLDEQQRLNAVAFAIMINNPEDLPGLSELIDPEGKTDIYARIASAYEDQKVKEIGGKIFDTYTRSIRRELRIKDQFLTEEIIFEDPHKKIERQFTESLQGANELFSPTEQDVFNDLQRNMSYDEIANKYNYKSNRVRAIVGRIRKKVESHLLMPKDFHDLATFNIQMIKLDEEGYPPNADITSSLRSGAHHKTLPVIKFLGQWYTQTEYARKHVIEKTKIVDHELLERGYIIYGELQHLDPEVFERIKYRYIDLGEKNLVISKWNVLYVSPKTIKKFQDKKYNPNLIPVTELTDDLKERNRLYKAAGRNTIKNQKTESGKMLVKTSDAKAFLSRNKKKSST